jgi:hypothetical protein
MIHTNFQQRQADERRKGEKQILTFLSTDSKSCSHKTKTKKENKQNLKTSTLYRERGFNCVKSRLQKKHRHNFLLRSR